MFYLCVGAQLAPPAKEREMTCDEGPQLDLPRCCCLFRGLGGQQLCHHYLTAESSKVCMGSCSRHFICCPRSETYILLSVSLWIQNIPLLSCLTTQIESFSLRFPFFLRSNKWHWWLIRSPARHSRLWQLLS